MQVCCTLAADPSRPIASRLRGTFAHKFLISNGNSWSSKCSDHNTNTPHLCLRSLWPRGRALEFIPGPVESGGRSNDCHVILQPKYA